MVKNMTRSKKAKTPTSISSVGETLVRNYGARLKVRKQRDALAPPERENVVGRQTTPELAALAAKYIKADTYMLEHLSVKQAAEVAADVRRLAASVLGQVNE